MWNSTDGGFMNSSINSPSAGGGSGNTGGKAKRAQNVVPVLIEEVLTAPEEGFSVEGTEVGMVKLVGRVSNIDKAATKTTYQIEDGTGTVDCVQWIEEGHSEPEFHEGSYIKVVGSVRTQGERKHIMTIKIMEVNSDEERDFHALEVAYSHLKLRQLNNKLGNGMGGGMGGLSNSMMGSSFGGGAMMGGAAPSSYSASFGNKNYDTVYSHIKACKDDNGITLSVLLNEIRGKMSKAEMDSAIDFLSSEGHIYSTVDDEHYRVTDEQD